MNKEELTSLFRVNPNKIHVIPHGSNELFYTDKDWPKPVAKRELGIISSQKVILFFGIIKRYKGLEYLVQAFEDIKRHVQNTTLLVVGRVYDSDTESHAFYSTLIDRMRGRDDIICVPDYIPFDKIGLYFSASDVVALPYTKAYTSGILLTAYAAGRPVVATDTGALKEAVEPGKSGLIVPPRDAKALSSAMVEILTRSDIEAMGRYAKHLAQARYSWTSVASQTSVLYRSLISTRL